MEWPIIVKQKFTGVEKIPKKLMKIWSELAAVNASYKNGLAV